MAVDKSYGSGKSRSAANSSARRRVAADQMTKSKKSPAEKIKAGRAKMAASPLGQLADTVLGFALPMGKVKAAAMGLRAAGNIKKAAALESRLKAKSAGNYLAQSLSPKREPGTGINSFFYGYGKADRAASQSVFPRAPKKGPMGQPDLGDLGAGRVGLPYNTPAQIRRTNRARRATQAGDRVYELEKRLNLPGTAPKKRGR